MIIIHNSHMEKYRNPFGAVRCKSTVQLSIYVSEDVPHGKVHAVIHSENDGIIRVDMNNDAIGEEGIYTSRVYLPETPCLLWYYFEINTENGRIYYGNNEKELGGEGQVYTSDPRPFQITVFPEDYHTPDWFKGATVYQIFVDRFFNGNPGGYINSPKPNSFIYANWHDSPMYIRNGEKIDRWEFFGGNLLGIIKKLDYLKELGVGAIYLNPVFEARSNHKYDTGNYMKIDPMFGDNGLFKQLCDAAREKGISIILDGVFSHTGADSIYFNKFGTYESEGACQSSISKYYSWYRFEEYPEKYECWWGVEDLPNVNEMDASYMDFIIHSENSVLNYWMKMGGKGWRLDVADELPDDFIGEIRSTIKRKNPDSILIGEVWEDATNKISYGKRRRYLYGGLLDSTTNYPLRTAIIDFIAGNISAGEFGSMSMSLYENYPIESFYSLLNMIGGHDVPRVLSVLTGKKADKPEELDTYTYKAAVKKMKLAVLLQMTLPGSPCIYYGDEAGSMGYEEPKNRATYPWGRENGELLEWYKKVTGLRKKFHSLITGSWKIAAASGDFLCIARYVTNNRDEFGNSCNNEAVIVAVNRGEEEIKNFEIDVSGYAAKVLTDAFTGEQANILEGKLPVNIEGFGYKVYNG